MEVTTNSAFDILVGSLVDFFGYVGKCWLHMLNAYVEYRHVHPLLTSAGLFSLSDGLCVTHALPTGRHTWQAVSWELSLLYTVSDLCLQTFHSTFQVTLSSCRGDFP